MHPSNSRTTHLNNAALFISDLHLCDSRPNITDAFLIFLREIAAKAKALYILGDLFEYWAGDDDIDDPFHLQIIHAFNKLAQSGVPIFLMHGNRDFLIAERFCTTAKITLLKDPSMIDWCGKKILLSHGDDLCTDDVAYQQFRAQVRNQHWQADFLSQPLAARKKQIEAIRMRSEQEKSIKNLEIMDVNPRAVITLLTQYQPDIFIHGHTHRPNQHAVHIGSKIITRWVLGDWYEQGSYLAMDETGCHNIKL